MPYLRPKQTICSYTNEENITCFRNALHKEKYCSLHLGADKDIAPEENPSFQKDFDAEILAKNGDWRGFVFPPKTTFPDEINFPVNARRCVFNALTLNKTVFKSEVDFSGSRFHKDTVLRGVTFEDVVFFSECHFLRQLETLNVKCKKPAYFTRSDFGGRTTLRINFEASANINQAIFRDGVNFSGWRNVTLQINSSLNINAFSVGTVVHPAKLNIYQRIALSVNAIKNWFKRNGQLVCTILKNQINKIKLKIKSVYESLVHKYSKSSPDSQIYHMFEDEGQLQDVVFLKPDQTVFTQVDLSKVYFRGTNLKGVRFLGVRWWQPRLKRNGLYDELFIRLSKDGAFRHQYLPVLEETCRNARVALEENRSFNVASDLYIGEMEAARAQLTVARRYLFSVNELYRFVSFYGTSVGTALRVLFWFFLFHLLLTLSFKSSTLSMDDIFQSSLRTFQVLLQQSPNHDATKWQMYIDSVFRVLGLIQIAMVAIAFRARIKRH